MLEETLTKKNWHFFNEDKKVTERFFQKEWEDF